MKRSVLCFVIMGFAIVVGFTYLTPAASAGGGEGVKVCTKAPDFFLRDLEGVMHRLSDLAFPGKETSWRKKKKVLIDFFRTDCEPCMKELPEVIKFHNKHKGKVQVLIIALLEEENGRAKLNQWLKKNKLPFPVLVDAYETAAKKYIVKGDTVSLPSIFLISENGWVRAKMEGLTTDLEAEFTGAFAAGCKKK